MSMKKGPLSQLMTNLIFLYVDKDIVEKTKDPLKLTKDLVQKFRGMNICSALIGLKNARNVVEHNTEISSSQKNMTRTTLLNILTWLDADAFRCNSLGYIVDKELRDESIQICKTGIAEITKSTIKNLVVNQVDKPALVEQPLPVMSQPVMSQSEIELRNLLKALQTADQNATQLIVNRFKPLPSANPILEGIDKSIKRKSEYSFDEELPFKKRKFVHTDNNTNVDYPAAVFITRAETDVDRHPSRYILKSENTGCTSLANPDITSLVDLKSTGGVIDQIQLKVDTLADLVERIKSDVLNTRENNTVKREYKPVKREYNKDPRMTIPIKSCKTFYELRGNLYNSLKEKRVFITSGPHRGCEFRFAKCDDDTCTLKTLSGKAKYIDPHTRFVLA